MTSTSSDNLSVGFKGVQVQAQGLIVIFLILTSISTGLSMWGHQKIEDRVNHNNEAVMLELQAQTYLLSLKPSDRPSLTMPESLRGRVRMEVAR